MMTLRRLACTAATAGALATLGGCLQQSGPRGGLASGPYGQPAASPVVVPLASASRPATGPIRPDGGTGLPGGATPTFVGPAPRAERVSAAPSGVAITRTLNLYGQVSDPTRIDAATADSRGGASGGSGGAGGASPLDSPDNLRPVTFATEGSDFDPELDPTGKLLVYASTQHRQTADLYLKRVDGTAVTQLTNDPGNDVMPAFSPDGKKIAFASDRGGNWDLYLIDAGGGQAIQLTNDATQDLHPSFSPDGKRLVYCSYGAQSGQWELVVMDLDRPSTRRFIGYGLFPRWSPTADRIVFQRSRERGTRWFSVWTVDLENGEGVRPTEIAASSDAAVITPSWSPDGTRLTFCTVPDAAAGENARPAQADVWVIGADGTGRANLTHSAFTNLQPVWARDGAIYFVSNRAKGGTENVWTIRPTGALALASRGPGGGSGIVSPASADPEEALGAAARGMAHASAPAQAAAEHGRAAPAAFPGAPGAPGAAEDADHDEHAEPAAPAPPAHLPAAAHAPEIDLSVLGATK